MVTRLSSIQNIRKNTRFDLLAHVCYLIPGSHTVLSVEAVLPILNSLPDMKGRLGPPPKESASVLLMRVYCLMKVCGHRQVDVISRLVLFFSLVVNETSNGLPRFCGGVIFLIGRPHLSCLVYFLRSPACFDLR